MGPFRGMGHDDVFFKVSHFTSDEVSFSHVTSKSGQGNFLCLGSLLFHRAPLSQFVSVGLHCPGTLETHL